MRKFFIALVFLCLITCIVYTAVKKSDGAETKTAFETKRQKISYSVGYHIGLSLKEIANDVDFAVVFQAIKDVAVKGKPQIPEEELKQIMTDFQAMLEQRRIEQRSRLGEKNKVEGEKFLKANAKTAGIKITKSNLQYKVIKQGNGPNPTFTDTVRVQYKGTLIDGTEFDSSFKHGKVAKLEVQHLLPGLKEGLEMMKVGSKYILYIPPELAYQDKGAGDVIGPYAVLIYEVELLGIETANEK